jgi:hypothetical protein
MSNASTRETDGQVIMAFFRNETLAESGLKALVEQDIPMDRVSMLGKASSSGDDPLGVYYGNVGERMKGWGKMGAFWGGLWGLLTGAAGMFLVPGIGPILAAGPVVEALAGAAGGAALTGGVLAGAGAATQLTVAVHRMGVPEERLEETRDRLGRGEHLLMLVTTAEESGHWRDALDAVQADPVWVFPYFGLIDAVRAEI